MVHHPQGHHQPTIFGGARRHDEGAAHVQGFAVEGDIAADADAVDKHFIAAFDDANTDTQAFAAHGFVDVDAGAKPRDGGAAHAGSGLGHGHGFPGGVVEGGGGEGGIIAIEAAPGWGDRDVAHAWR